MKIAIQGQEASFHDIAARQFFGENIELVPCKTFADVFEVLENGQADNGIVAIENSLFGSINDVYDLLLVNKFWIIGEVSMRVEQCLIGLPGTKLEDIKEVHSHPVALAQCDEFLEESLPKAERFEHYDTAGSVADVKKWNNPTKAAIGSSASAKLHGLEVLSREIETHKQNYTRFAILAKNKQKVIEANKTSLVFHTDKDVRPGALHHALGAFAKRDLNLTMLQSRPVLGRVWHYLFYIDVAVALDNPEFQDALGELKANGCDVTVLGSYQSAVL